MATQREVLDAIQTSVRPYAIATHQRIAKQLCVRIDRVTRAAMEYAEEIDSFQKGNPPIEKLETVVETPENDYQNQLLNQLRQIAESSMLDRETKNEERQFTEAENMRKALATVDLVTPELLVRVGCELPNK